jgi:glycosyltransferase involved in cell wall biosynthesis
VFRLSATIITNNEAASVGRTIRSLSVADEIVVVDAGSTDGTQQAAARLGARVIVHPFTGFAAQKNFASEQSQNDWILSLDADEELNAEAQEAVRRWKGTGSAPPLVAGYRFARRARYLGRWILHAGWYPDWKLRLYDRRRGRWEGAYVHESVAATGAVETLPGEILHYTCDSLKDHRDRIEFYTDLAAREMLEGGAQATWLRRALAPPWVFLNTYFFRLGVLDGYPGFVIARMAAHYVRRKYAKWAAMAAEEGLKAKGEKSKAQTLV